MADITKPNEIIALLAARADAAGQAARQAIIGFVRHEAGPSIAILARQKAPVLFGGLKASVQNYDIPDGHRIAFGGKAARYAAAVHRKPDEAQIIYTGARAYKWVYSGFGVTASARGGWLSNPGEWNLPSGEVGLGFKGRITAWTNAITRGRAFYGGATGEELIEWTGNNWRFRKVDYEKRFPATAYPKQGQSHFLFGKPNSALEEKREWMLQQSALRGAKAASEAVRRGAA